MQGLVSKFCENFFRAPEFHFRSRSLNPCYVRNYVQEKFSNNWKSQNRWNSRGIIETFMDPTTGLSTDIEDFCWVLSKIGLIRFTQSDTEMVVKTIRKVEGRFTGFDEVKLDAGKRDRANQEIFLHENPVALSKLPLEDMYQTWRKKHQASWKKQSAKNIFVSNFKKNDKSKAHFLE